MTIPCRRRAIWAAQAAVTNAQEISHEQKDETRNNADATLQTGELNGGRGRNHSQALPEGADSAQREKTAHVEVKANKNKPAAKEKVTCPKCGRKGNQGMAVHIKYCRGLNA